MKGNLYSNSSVQQVLQFPLCESLLVRSERSTWKLPKMTQPNVLYRVLAGLRAARPGWDPFSTDPIKTQRLQRRFCFPALVLELFNFLPSFLSNCTQRSSGESGPPGREEPRFPCCGFYSCTQQVDSQVKTHEEKKGWWCHTAANLRQNPTPLSIPQVKDNKKSRKKITVSFS